MPMKISELINEISSMKARGAFQNYIEYIQFPYFRNLEKNTRITFDFPLTVFVGQNGSGKSSTLHALYGAPKRNTPFEFWFSTAVDPIQEVSEGGDRHSFFYVYKDERGNELEVLKQRILKRNNPDYWETARPNFSYGMQRLPEGSRNEPIEKNVMYIDFRSELSAFDKYFYFKTPNRSARIKNKQDYLRKYSFFLKRIFDQSEKIITRYREIKNDALRIISIDELNTISNILGKPFTGGKIVRHKLFDEWGYSVLFETSNYSYSEAFAGSGEIAVVKLVIEVLNAEKYSLVLLDEPEVSLHPGAQKRLKQFLLEEIRRKQLQIILSTHSPNIIEDLPSNAIKVFSQLPSGKFNVLNAITPKEAFYYLEHTNPEKKILIVEDILSKEIISGVLKELGEATASLFQINYFSGGSSVLKNNYITVYSHSEEFNKFIIFDGDQKIAGQHFNPKSVLELEQTNERFKQEIINQTGIDVKFYTNSNPNEEARLEQEKQLRKKYLEYYLRNVFYLPLSIPEEIIWNNELATSLLQGMDKKDLIDKINNVLGYKDKFLSISDAITGDKRNIVLPEKMFLEKWLRIKDINYDNIVAIILKIRDL